MITRASEDIMQPPPPARHFNEPRSHPAGVIWCDKSVTATGGLLSLFRPRRWWTVTELWDSGALQLSATWSHRCNRALWDSRVPTKYKKFTSWGPVTCLVATLLRSVRTQLRHFLHCELHCEKKESGKSESLSILQLETFVHVHFHHDNHCYFVLFFSALKTKLNSDPKAEVPLLSTQLNLVLNDTTA